MYSKEGHTEATENNPISDESLKEMPQQR